MNTFLARVVWRSCAGALAGIAAALMLDKNIASDLLRDWRQACATLLVAALFYGALAVLVLWDVPFATGLRRRRNVAQMFRQ
ncbi:MAG: hypothetical protein ABI905_04865 [Betaproteobacteria bacterium]